MDANTPSNIEAASWLFENTLDVLLVIREGRIEVASPSWRFLTGWTDAETLGRDCRDFVHPDEVRAFETQVAILRQGGAVCCDHRLLSRAGEWLWVRSRTKGASHGRSIAVLQDISAERRAADEQARAARLAELLGDKAGISLWRFDPLTGVYDFSSNLDGAGGGDPSLIRAGDEMAAEIHPDGRDHSDRRGRHAGIPSQCEGAGLAAPAQRLERASPDGERRLGGSRPQPGRHRDLRRPGCGAGGGGREKPLPGQCEP